MSDLLEQVIEIAAEENIGRLGIVTPEGYPRVVPVNFVWHSGAICFHGALDGEKFEAFMRNAPVTFSIEHIYALIPSYWRSETSACPATQYFRSVLIYGRGRVIEDASEKAGILQALMDKHQPEGGFRKFDPNSRTYRAAIDEVGIFRIEPNRITLKTKLGQNLSERTREQIIARLRERGSEIDLATADGMVRHNRTPELQEKTCHES